MKIAIDCRHIDSSGIGVYLKGCLPFFLDTKNEFILFGNSGQLQFADQNKNTKIIHCTVKPFSPRDTFFFPKIILKQINSADIFYSPSFNIPGGIKIPIYTTIHDIVFPDMPELTSKIGLVLRMWFFRRAYKKSCIIYTVSEFSKSRITFHLGKLKPIIVTYSAIQYSFIKYKVKAGNISKNETIIFIGNMKKNKGLGCLLDAFKKAKNEGLPHNLVIVGNSENFRTVDNLSYKIIELFENKNIYFTGYIFDELLMDYLSQASLLIQPSLYEGFGLPPLEAMVLGTPALISDIPVFKEVYKDFPVTFFRTGDSDDLKNKMMDILIKNKSSSNKTSVPILSGELVKKYTFEKTSKIIEREFK